MFDYIFGKDSESDNEKVGTESLLEEGNDNDNDNDYDNLCFDATTKRVKYLDDLMDYKERKEFVVKFTLTFVTEDNKYVERNVYHGSLHSHNSKKNYYTFTNVNIVPKLDVGKIILKVEIKKNFELFYKNEIMFRYIMNNDRKNLFENVCITVSPGNELIMTLNKNENNKFVLEHIKYMRTLE